MNWYYIDIHYATFGIAVKDNIVVKTAPIGNWMIGKDFQFIYDWVVNKKKGEMIKL